jgi:hypothetical protein
MRDDQMDVLFFASKVLVTEFCIYGDLRMTPNCEFQFII